MALDITLISAEITADDLPECLRPVWDAVGPEAAIRIAFELAGSRVSFPKHPLRHYRNRQFLSQFNGKNLQHAARRCGISIRTAYRNLHRPARKSKWVNPAQTDLFVATVSA